MDLYKSKLERKNKRMKIITRYILKEHIAPFLYSVATIVFIFLLNIVFRDLGKLIGKGLSFTILMEFFSLNLAWIIALAVPMAVLIATLMAFGRLSADKEIAALKSSGVNLYRLVAPVLAASVILSALLVKFNDTVLPEFNHKVRMLYTDIARKKPTLTLEPNVFFDAVPGYSILVKKIEGKDRLLKNVIINNYNNRETNQTIIAETGKVTFAEKQDKIIFTLFNGEIHIVNKKNLESYRRISFPKWVLSISVPNMSLNRSKRGYRGDREKTVAMMKKDIIRNRAGLERREKGLEKHVENHLKNIFPEYLWPENNKTGKPEFIPQKHVSLRTIMYTARYVKTENLVINGFLKSISKHEVEIQKKYSIATACIVFVLLGASLGVMGRQGGLAVSAGFSIFFFLVHWAMLIGGEQLADRLYVSPFVAMWSPNILLGAAGIYLLIHTVKEVPIIQWSILNPFKKGQKK